MAYEEGGIIVVPRVCTRVCLHARSAQPLRMLRRMYFWLVTGGGEISLAGHTQQSLCNSAMLAIC
jgi:hypothetical protein